MPTARQSREADGDNAVFKLSVSRADEGDSSRDYGVISGIEVNDVVMMSFINVFGYTNFLFKD